MARVANSVKNVKVSTFFLLLMLLITFTLNRGIELARVKYIVRMDADDIASGKIGSAAFIYGS